jgi:hypothetical protein
MIVPDLPSITVETLETKTVSYRGTQTTVIYNIDHVLPSVSEIVKIRHPAAALGFNYSPRC